MVVVEALTALSIVMSMGLKIYDSMQKGKPVDLTDEISRLNAARLKTSEEIIAEADAAMGKK
jgi:hypothetical protein